MRKHLSPLLLLLLLTANASGQVLLAVQTPEAPSEDLVLDATLERWDGGSGELDISNGVIFKEGDVTEEDVTNRLIRVFVDGVEQAVYTEALDGRWPDGTVKSVLIQFANTFTGTETAEIRVGTVRGTTDISEQSLIPEPDGMLCLTDPDYLCSAFPLWYQILPIADHPTSTGIGAELDGIHTKYNSVGDSLWATVEAASTDSAKWGVMASTANYDASKHQYAYYCMTGESKHLERAVKNAHYLSAGYGEPNNWGLPEQHQVAMAGMLLHYWLTGTETSRTSSYELLQHSNNPALFTLASIDTPNANGDYAQDGRIVHTVMLCLVIAHHLGLDADHGQVASESTNALKCRALIDSWIDQQEVDGSRKHQNVGNADCTLSGITGTFQEDEYLQVNSVNFENYLSTIDAGTYVICRNNGRPLVVSSDSIVGQTSAASATVDTVGAFRAGTQPWMNHLANSAMVAYSRWVSSDRDAEIKECLENDYEYMDSYWDGTDNAWPIYDTEANFHVVPDYGDPDLNAFPLAVFDWLIEHETDPTTKAAYIARGDLAVEGINDGDGWSLAKQYNQMNWGFWQYVKRRAE